MLYLACILSMKSEAVFDHQRGSECINLMLGKRAKVASKTRREPAYLPPRSKISNHSFS